MPEMGLVTVFWPFTTAGSGETVIQTTGETRFVVDCKVNPVEFVGHVKTTLALDGVIVNASAVPLSRRRSHRRSSLRQRHDHEKSSNVPGEKQNGRSPTRRPPDLN